MRKRAKRDLFTLAGVVVVVASIVLVNMYLRREGLRGHYERLRAAFEAKHREQGVALVDWKELHEVTGRRATGANFPESLKEKNGRLVNLCGFMSPIDQFKNVTEFMLLPVPMSCYFCDAPPMRDIVRVRLQKPADMVNEPVLIGGRLELHEGPKQMFFYTIKDAKWNEAVKDEAITQQNIGKDHKVHLVEGFDQLRRDAPEEPLVQGYTPPTTVSEPVVAPPPAAPAESAPAPPAN